MTTRIITHLPSIQALRAALPSFVESLQGNVDRVVARYNELVALYNTKLVTVQKHYEEAMSEISELRNCSCSEDCNCLSRYESMSAQYYSEYMSRVSKLQAIMEPVESRIRVTPMFDSMQRIHQEVEPYQQGLANFLNTAQMYLETER